MSYFDSQQDLNVINLNHLNVNALYLNFFKEQQCDLFVKAFDVNALDLKVVKVQIVFSTRF